MGGMKMAAELERESFLDDLQALKDYIEESDDVTVEEIYNKVDALIEKWEKAE